MDAADAAGGKETNAGHAGTEHCARDGRRSQLFCRQGDGEVAPADFLYVLRRT